MDKAAALLIMAGMHPDDVSKSSDPRFLFEEFLRAEEAKNMFETYTKRIREKLFEAADKFGEKDDKGSAKVTFPDGKWFKKEARVSVSINREKVLEKHEITPLSFVKEIPVFDDDKLDEVVKVVEVHLPEAIIDFKKEINEAGIEEAYVNGELTDDDIREIITKKVVYALKKSRK